MKTRVLLVMAVSLLIAADATEDVKKEKEKLKGTWSLVAVQVPKGEKGPTPKEIKEMKMIFGEDQMTPKFGDKEDKPASYKIDPSKNPKEIDMMPGDRMVKGIYLLAGDTLKLCLAQKGDRPKQFKADKEETILMTLKRDKK